MYMATHRTCLWPLDALPLSLRDHGPPTSSTSLPWIKYSLDSLALSVYRRRISGDWRYDPCLSWPSYAAWPVARPPFCRTTNRRFGYSFDLFPPIAHLVNRSLLISRVCQLIRSRLKTVVRWKYDAVTTVTHRFNSRFSGKPGLAD